jgi:hypothetical protein
MNLSTTFIHSLWDSLKSALIVDSSLTVSVRSVLAGEPLSRFARRRCVVLLAALCVVGTTPAYSATYSIDHLKLYAHSRIINWEQFQCFNKIITKESRWSYTARNGSHWGLGQMRSEWYRDLDPYRQIDATLKYITKRYQTPCKAWAFHIERNHY